MGDTAVRGVGQIIVDQQKQIDALKEEVMSLKHDNDLSRMLVSLLSLLSVVRETCGLNNCNCPGAGKVKSAAERAEIERRRLER